jgi:hypothetical protein
MTAAGDVVERRTANGKPSLQTLVVVDLFAVVGYVRYAMGRKTYANEMAASLARRVWPEFPQSIRDQIRRDAAMLAGTFEARAWAWLTEEEPH